MDALIRKFIQEHVLFKDYANNQDFITSLISVMKPRLYMDGDFIIKKGEIGRAMFFNLKGSVDVVSEDGETIINYMEDGAFFGEIGVLYSVPRTVSCRSNGKSIMLILTKDALAKALESYPKISQSIASIAKERYSSHLKKKASAVEDEFGDELKLSITQNELQNVSFFRDASIGFLHSLAMSLKPVKYYRNQILFKKNDPASEMFFVAKGCAEAVDETRTIVYAQFQPGSFFGEVAVFGENQTRTATVQCASEELLVFKCEKAILTEILSEFPEVHEKIEQELARRMEYINNRTLADLPPDQIQATEIENIRQKLQQISLFASSDIGFLHSLALQLKVKRCIPGTIIVKEGEPADCMYFIIDGTVQIISNDATQIYAEIGKDSYFGEVGLFYDINRTASVRAKTESTLVILSKKTMNETLKAYGGLHDSIREKAREHYQNHLRRIEKIKQDGVNSSIMAKSEFTILDRLQKVSLFKNCDIDFLQNLASKITIKTYGHKQIIFEKGSKSLEMYFLAEGSVNVVSDDLSIVFDTIEVGGFFGEIGVIKGTSRNATLISNSPNTVTLVLSEDQIQNSLQSFPSSYEAIILACDERIRKAYERDSRSKHANGALEGEININQPLLVSTLVAPEKKEPAGYLGDVCFAGKVVGDPESSESTLELFIDQKRTFSDDLSVKELHLRKRPIQSILDLNDYELSIVFYKIDFLSKLKLRKVCKQWEKQIASSYFCKSITLEKQAADVSSKLLKSLVGFTGSTVAYLNLSNCGRITDDVMGLVCINCKLITQLILSNCWKLTDLSLHHIGQNLALLEHLDISHCSKFIGQGFQNHKMTKLARFNSSYCKALGDKPLEKLLSSTPDLKVVQIRRCTRLTEFGVFLIVRFCRKLELLDMRDCDFVTDRCLRWIATSCFHLHSINLSFCSKVSQVGLADFANGLQSYKSIDLSNCNLTDSSIFQLKYCIKNIRYLSLRNCSQISDAIASHLAIHARKLRLLELSGCRRITPALEHILKTVNPKINIILSRENRKIYVPGHPSTGKPPAFEISLRDLHTSGPKQLMESGSLVNQIPKLQDLNVRKFLRHIARKGNRQRKPPSLLMKPDCIYIKKTETSLLKHQLAAARFAQTLFSVHQFHHLYLVINSFRNVLYSDLEYDSLQDQTQVWDDLLLLLQQAQNDVLMVDHKLPILIPGAYAAFIESIPKSQMEWVGSPYHLFSVSLDRIPNRSDLSTVELIDGEEMESWIDRLTLEDIDAIVNLQTVAYERSYLIALVVQKPYCLLNSCIRVSKKGCREKSSLASWCLTHYDFTIGLVATNSQYKRKLFAQRCIIDVLHKQKESLRTFIDSALAFVSAENRPSFNLLLKCGFQKVSDEPRFWAGLSIPRNNL